MTEEKKPKYTASSVMRAEQDGHDWRHRSRKGEKKVRGFVKQRETPKGECAAHKMKTEERSYQPG